MKILLTGATGYIAKRLLPVLLDRGHRVVCCVRDRQRFDTTSYDSNLLEIIELDFLEPETMDAIPGDIDAAYYLIHSMSASDDDFESLELRATRNFRKQLAKTAARQVIYLGGIVNSKKLSPHLRSRKRVEEELARGPYDLTTLRAGIIVGSGSASFEIIRDLVEKLPVMIAPKWLNTSTHPIAIRNVIQFLEGVLGRTECMGESYDIGGPEVLTYREMLEQFAKERGLKRTLITVPVLTPKLSSYWLYFVTSTSYRLAVNLVDSMKVDVVGEPNHLHELLGIELIPYRRAISLAFDKLEQKDVLSSWTDARSSNTLQSGVSRLAQVPVFGCFKDEQHVEVDNREAVTDRVWDIGGETGWYYVNGLWALRGFFDKMAGGVGLQRGRKSSRELQAGDSLDFWRVLYADRGEGRLLLYAEMKMPGEAWLEFQVGESTLHQIATFRPRGVWGRIYWYMLLPFHLFIFRGMAQRIASG